MPKVNMVYVVLAFCFLLFSYVRIGYSIEPVVIEFLYREPCLNCPNAEKYNEIYLHNNQTINNIQNDYGTKVLVKRIWFYSSEGEAKRDQYGISITDWNSIVINHEVIIHGDRKANETYIRELIDFYLGESPSPPQPPPSQPLDFISVIILAFSFGFFETFSPCLVIMLSFILSYTIGKTVQCKESFLRIMIFGVGFVSAGVLLGLAFGLVFLSVPTLHVSLTVVVCVFAIFFGLNLLGLLKVPFQTKPLIRKLARKYVTAYTGILILGFIFYFLDPCIAPIFISMVPLLLPDLLPLIFFVFCLGAIIPFVGIGIFAGSVSKLSKLARSTYKHRFKIRAISGLILMGYALYLIALLLFRN